MTLSTANIVQENTGSSGTTSLNHVVTLPSGTTAGNSVILFIASGSATNDVLAPSGSSWVLDLDHSSGMQAFRLPAVAAGVTSWTFTTATASVEAWYVAEVSGIDTVDPLDAFVNNVSSSLSTGGSLTPTTAITAGLSTIAFAAFSVRGGGTAGTTFSVAGYTNGFAERADIGGPDPAPGMAVAVNTAAATQAWSTAGTVTISGGGSETVNAFILSYREASTPIVTPLAALFGFEWGTIGGSGGTSTAGMWPSGSAPVGTWNTNYLIQAGSARNGSYGLRVVQSAAAAYVTPYSFNGAGMTASIGMNVRVVSGSGVVIVSELTVTGSIAMQLVYDVTATKFGVRSTASGTIQYQPGTTALNTWAWVDLRVATNSTTWAVDWRIETAASTYTTQTQATAAGQTPTALQLLRLGGNATQTGTFDFDDVVISRYGGVHPLGPHVVKLLTVDPAGTPTTTTPATDFNVMTANGTLAAWNATNARNAVDEVPVTVSASSDGVVQVAVNASGYAEFPMANYTLGAKEVVAGVRALAAMWNTSAGSTSTFGLRGWDGTNETTLLVPGTATNFGQPTAYATTAPIWRTAMWPKTNGWSQADLNAAALRFGFSTDVAPGVQALYLEFAVGQTANRKMFGDLTAVEADPYRGGAVSLSTTSPAMGDTGLYYETGGTPTTTTVTAGTTATQQPNAAFDSDLNYVAAYPPAEPAPTD